MALRPNHSTPCNGTLQCTTSTPPKLVVTLSSPHHSTRQWHPAMAPSNGTTSTALCNATSNPPKWFVALPPIGSKNPYSYRYLGIMVLRKPGNQPIKLYQHRPQRAKTNFCVINVENRCNVCKKLMTKFIVVFCGVCVKLVALNIGGYETGIGTLQWHPAIAPRPLPQGWSLPSPPSTIAHYNGTLQWHPAMALRPLPQSTPQWHPAMALRPLLQSWSSPPPSPP